MEEEEEEAREVIVKAEYREGRELFYLQGSSVKKVKRKKQMRTGRK